MVATSNVKIGLILLGTAAISICSSSAFAEGNENVPVAVDQLGLNSRHQSDAVAAMEQSIFKRHHKDEPRHRVSRSKKNKDSRSKSKHHHHHSDLSDEVGHVAEVKKKLERVHHYRAQCKGGHKHKNKHGHKHGYKHKSKRKNKHKKQKGDKHHKHHHKHHHEGPPEVEVPGPEIDPDPEFCPLLPTPPVSVSNPNPEIWPPLPTTVAVPTKEQGDNHPSEGERRRGPGRNWHVPSNPTVRKSAAPKPTRPSVATAVNPPHIAHKEPATILPTSVPREPRHTQRFPPHSYAHPPQSSEHVQTVIPHEPSPSLPTKVHPPALTTLPQPHHVVIEHLPVDRQPSIAQHEDLKTVSTRPAPTLEPEVKPRPEATVVPPKPEIKTGPPNPPAFAIPTKEINPPVSKIVPQPTAAVTPKVDESRPLLFPPLPQHSPPRPPVAALPPPVESVRLPENEPPATTVTTGPSDSDAQTGGNHDDVEGGDQDGSKGSNEEEEKGEEEVENGKGGGGGDHTVDVQHLSPVSLVPSLNTPPPQPTSATTDNSQEGDDESEGGESSTEGDDSDPQVEAVEPTVSLPEPPTEPEAITLQQPTTLRVPEPQPTTSQAQKPQLATLKAPEPQPTTLQEPKPQPTALKAPEPQPTILQAPKPQPITLKAPEPQPVTLKAPEPEHTTLQVPKPQPTTLQASEPEPTILQAPEPHPTTLQTPEPQPTTLQTPEPQPTTLQTPEPQLTTLQTPEPQPTNSHKATDDVHTDVPSSPDPSSPDSSPEETEPLPQAGEDEEEGSDEKAGEEEGSDEKAGEEEGSDGKAGEEGESDEKAGDEGGSDGKADAEGGSDEKAGDDAEKDGGESGQETQDGEKEDNEDEEGQEGNEEEQDDGDDDNNDVNGEQKEGVNNHGIQARGGAKYNNMLKKRGLELFKDFYYAHKEPNQPSNVWDPLGLGHLVTGEADNSQLIGAEGVKKHKHKHHHKNGDEKIVQNGVYSASDSLNAGIKENGLDNLDASDVNGFKGEGDLGLVDGAEPDAGTKHKKHKKHKKIHKYKNDQGSPADAANSNVAEGAIVLEGDQAGYATTGDDIKTGGSQHEEHVGAQGHKHHRHGVTDYSSYSPLEDALAGQRPAYLPFFTPKSGQTDEKKDSKEINKSGEKEKSKHNAMQPASPPLPPLESPQTPPTQQAPAPAPQAPTEPKKHTPGNKHDEPSKSHDTQSDQDVPPMGDKKSDSKNIVDDSGYGTVPMFGPAQLELGNDATRSKLTLWVSAGAAALTSLWMVILMG